MKILEDMASPRPFSTLQWRRNGCDSVSNHQSYDCLLQDLFKRRSKKTSKLRVTGLCAGNSPETGEFPAQMASNAENVSIWWRHHGKWQKRFSLTQLLLTTCLQYEYLNANVRGIISCRIGNVQNCLVLLIYKVRVIATCFPQQPIFCSLKAI